jgi:hypothetical protein
VGTERRSAGALERHLAAAGPGAQITRVEKPEWFTSRCGESMKAIILAGGLGSRLSEETVARPKPMVEIGGKPILWHIMNIF